MHALAASPMHRAGRAFLNCTGEWPGQARAAQRRIGGVLRPAAGHLLRQTLPCSVGVLAFTSPLWAANGLVSPGNGTTQLGMAGAGTALAEDPAATIRNPAAGVWMGSGRTFDLGLAVPKGGYNVGPVGPESKTGIFEISPGRDSSVTGVFPLPTFAYNRRVNDDNAWGIGVSVAGLKSLSSGNTATLVRGIRGLEAHCAGTYGSGDPVAGNDDPQHLCGHSGADAGVNLAQLYLSAYWARRLLPNLSLGVAPVFLAQRLSIRGLGTFAAFSDYPDQTSDNGGDVAFGGGARAGLLWEVGAGVGVGLAYQSRIWTTDFNKYRGLVIGGALDQAPIYNLGLQFHVTPGLRMLVDVEHIAYSEVRSLRNGFETQRFTDECLAPRLLTRLGAKSSGGNDASCLGGRNGPGFGWRDMTVFKLGSEFRSGRLTARAGYSYGRQPLRDGQILSAVFAPGITERHAAAGLSWALSPRLSLDWALLYAIRHTLTGQNSLSSITVNTRGLTLQGFSAEQDAQDQTIQAHVSVLQSQFGLTWHFD